MKLLLGYETNRAFCHGKTCLIHFDTCTPFYDLRIEVGGIQIVCAVLQNIMMLTMFKS